MGEKRFFRNGVNPPFPPSVLACCHNKCYREGDFNSAPVFERSLIPALESRAKSAER